MAWLKTASEAGSRRQVAQPAHAQEHDPRVDAGRLEQRVHQARLVLAVAEATGEHLLHRIGLEAVDAELEPDVARARDHLAVDRLHDLPPELRLSETGVLRPGPHLGHDAGRRGADAGAGTNLLPHQPLVEAGHLVPGGVGGDVNRGRKTRTMPGHPRLEHEARQVGGGPAVLAQAAGRIFHGP